MQEQAVVRHIDQKIRAVDDKSPNEIADGIFETYKRRDANIAARQIEYGVLSTGGEVARHPDDRDRGKRRKRMPQRNVFAERNKMHFSVQLAFPVRRNKPRSIVGAIAFFVIRAKQKVGSR